MNNIASALQEVQSRIARAAQRSGRDVSEITLVGVTKTVDSGRINQAIEAGLQHIGENRIQEARRKFADLIPGATRHLIGHLQRNKVKYAVELFDMIQSVDSLELAQEISSRMVQRGAVMPVLIEVNTSGEESKFGCRPPSAIALLHEIEALPGVIARGFMTIAIFSDDQEKVRSCFRSLKRIFDEARELKLPDACIDTLSMGMSSDFELAIEEGATMVRVGSAIFGARPATA